MILKHDSVIVSWDFSNGEDASILLVGRQRQGKMDIINMYQGKEAEELYQKLVEARKIQKISYVKGETGEATEKTNI